MAQPSKKRILMITTDHLMIDRRILLEAKTLIASGYNVRLLAGFECPEPAQYEIDGLKIHRYSYDWSDRRIDWLLPSAVIPARVRSQLIRAGRKAMALFTGFTSFEYFVLRKILEFDYDILHCHDFPLLKVACEAVRRRPVKFVYDAHELYHAQTQLPQTVQDRYRQLERRLIGRPNLVITVNPFIADIMARDYGIPSPHVILNATTVEPKPAVDRLRELTGLTPSDSVVVYQGWISADRGIEHLVRCAAHFPQDVHLVLIGYGSFEADLRDLSRRQGTDDGRVIFLGQLSNQELAELTPYADLGAIPYHGVDLNNHYCSPNKLFEFIAAGVPFVCNDLPFLGSILVQHGCGLTVDFADDVAAGQAIASLLGNAQALATLKDAAQKASETLNWNVEGAKLLKLYSTII